MLKNNPIRRGQCITTFGPGSVTISSSGEPLLVAALDAWYKDIAGNAPPNISEYEFSDDRLARQLGVKNFRIPPDYDVQGIHQLRIPTLLYPRWYACTNNACQALHCFQPNGNELRMNPAGTWRFVKCPECNSNRPMRPMPLLAVCGAGHLQDFPFRQWVHRQMTPQCNQKMRVSGFGGSLQSMTVTCGCGNASRNLAGALGDITGGVIGPAQPYQCRGHRAWLGIQNQQICQQSLVGVLYSASNVYYSDVRSSIFLPIQPDGLANVPQELLDSFDRPEVSAQLAAMGVDPDPIHVNMFALFYANNSGYDQALVVQALNYYLGAHQGQRPIAPSINGPDGQPLDDYSETEFRYAEYEKLASDEAIDSDSLIVESTQLAANCQGIFNRIRLVHRLRETRALVGFSRLQMQQQAGLAQKRSLMWWEAPEDWLPGFFVHGEGIFLELAPGWVDNLPGVQELWERQRRKSRVQEDSHAFITIHTFAHLLIRRLAFECGYSAASMRERLYVRTEGDQQMLGVLIYTAQSDSEGAMGGLVRMGRPEIFERVLARTLEDAKWCSSDPVCLEAANNNLNGANGAACHACCILPETSCECFNEMLDRSVFC